MTPADQLEGVRPLSGCFSGPDSSISPCNHPLIFPTRVSQNGGGCRHGRLCYDRRVPRGFPMPFPFWLSQRDPQTRYLAVSVLYCARLHKGQFLV
jgi:hypothetical protein